MSFADDGRLAALSGPGGQLILYPDRLRVLRHGPWFTALNLVFHLEREIETTILLHRLTGVHLVQSLLLVQFLRFTYAGCPAPSGHYLRDAFAENAFLASFIDNRPLVAFQAAIIIAARRLAPMPLSGAELAH
ncbi:MAG: hypothetical protein EON47_04465 [Acetobacteraceae bacterium]|nr:MAG: hypothetical protein EON47_04465 [Acetobacteraceae bacterium]